MDLQIIIREMRKQGSKKWAYNTFFTTFFLKNVDGNYEKGC